MLFLLILAIAALVAVVAVSVFGMLLIKAAIDDILEEFRCCGHSEGMQGLSRKTAWQEIHTDSIPVIPIPGKL